MSSTTKKVRDLAVGDRIVGIETTKFDAPTTIVKVNPAMAICEHGGAYLLSQMGHFTVYLAD